ncbi:MAG: OmpA family protein [Desulfobulbaceae bacterium]|nr:OmpA family protein [Desulfobulbaceae bacterium]
MRKISSSLLVFFVCLAVAAATQAAPPDYMLKKMGTINGRIYIDGHPAPDALISFFDKDKGLPPIGDGLRRVPEFLTRTNMEGRFMIKVLAGNYYTGVLLRRPGAAPGPPRQDEQYYFVKGAKSDLGVLIVKEREVIDLGRLDAEAAESFKSREESFIAEGVVRDKNGNPVRGVVVLAKSQLNIPRPEFISERTDENGFYRIQLPPGMPFYLMARETVAGARPTPGSHIGTYGIESESGLATPSIFGAGSPPPGAVNEGNSGKALTVSGGAGEVSGNVDIFMYTVPDPEGIRTSIQGTINSPKYEKGAELENITFAPARYKLTESSFAELDNWLAFLKNRAEIKVELRGHTDSLGSPEYNKELSRKRAGAVAAYLVGKGIDSERLLIKGFGPEQPVATNDTKDGRELNRRVEIKFVD